MQNGAACSGLRPLQGSVREESYLFEYCRPSYEMGISGGGVNDTAKAEPSLHGTVKTDIYNTNTILAVKRKVCIQKMTANMSA